MNLIYRLIVQKNSLHKIVPNFYSLDSRVFTWQYYQISFFKYLSIYIFNNNEKNQITFFYRPWGNLSINLFFVDFLFFIRCWISKLIITKSNQNIITSSHHDRNKLNRDIKTRLQSIINFHPLSSSFYRTRGRSFVY